MKDLEKFDTKIRNLDPEEFKEALSNHEDTKIYQVQDHDERFRYAINIKGKPFYSTFYVFRGMSDQMEKKAFDQMIHSQRTGWVPTLDEKGHGYVCAYCGARAQDNAAVNLACPCRL